MPQQIKNLKCGSKIKFGSYQVESEATHNIRWIRVTDDTTTFLAEFIEDLRAFDSAECGNDSSARASLGSNRYAVSNIDNFLNSSEENWFKPMHESDCSPEFDNTIDGTPYKEHPGFLSYFKKEEIDAIEPTTLESDLPYREICETDGTREGITRKVFLPTKANLRKDYRHDFDKGEYWEFFDLNSIATGITEEVEFHNKSSLRPARDKWYYFLRDPNGRSDSSVQVVYSNDVYIDEAVDAYRGCVGIRPAIVIKPETLVSDEPDDEGYYLVVVSGIETINVDENEFLTVI